MSDVVCLGFWSIVFRSVLSVCGFSAGPKVRRIPEFLRGVKVSCGRHESDVCFFMNLASSFSVFLPFVDVPSFGAGGWLDEPGGLGFFMLVRFILKSRRYLP